MPLKIGKDGFSLPLGLVTSTQAIFDAEAKRQELHRVGSGRGAAGEAVKNGVVSGSEMLFLKGKARGR